MPITLTYSLADQNFNRTKSLGILNFSVQLLRHLCSRQEIEALTLLSNRTMNLDDILAKNIRIHQCDMAIAGRVSRVGWDQWGLYKAATEAGNEWLFLPKGFASFLRKPHVRLASYVQDTLHDYYHDRCLSGIPRGESKYFRSCLRATIKQSQIIFTSSNFTKMNLIGIAEREGRKLPPIVVAGIGFESPIMPPREKRDRVLLLASPWPNKRTDLVVDYLERWRCLSAYSGVIEVIGGTPASLVKPEGGGWEWLPRLEPTEFDRRMSEARVLVYSSEFEGFGMPPVEAILRNTCPVYSDIPPTREVMSGAGFSFSNDDFDSFVQAMTGAFRVPPERLDAWKRDLLARHDWDTVVSRIVSGLAEHSRSGTIR